jgi:hypothetical protein
VERPTYEAGKSVTIVRPDGSTVTYSINDQSQLPPMSWWEEK